MGMQSNLPQAAAACGLINRGAGRHVRSKSAAAAGLCRRPIIAGPRRKGSWRRRRGLGGGD